jgi:hypothetical protein
MGAAIGIHWSLALSAAALLSLVTGLLFFTQREKALTKPRA